MKNNEEKPVFVGLKEAILEINQHIDFIEEIEATTKDKETSLMIRKYLMDNEIW